MDPCFHLKFSLSPVINTPNYSGALSLSSRGISSLISREINDADTAGRRGTKDKLNSSIDDEFGQPSRCVHRPLSVHRSFLALCSLPPPLLVVIANQNGPWRGVFTLRQNIDRREERGLDSRNGNGIFSTEPLSWKNEIASHDFFLPIRDPRFLGKFFLPVDHPPLVVFEKYSPKSKFQGKCLFSIRIVKEYRERRVKRGSFYRSKLSPE